MESGFNPMLKTWMLSASSPTNTGFKKIPNDLQPGGCCLKSFMSVFDYKKNKNGTFKPDWRAF